MWLGLQMYFVLSLAECNAILPVDLTTLGRIECIEHELVLLYFKRSRNVDVMSS
jgi:hypothetical protein